MLHFVQHWNHVHALSEAEAIAIRSRRGEVWKVSENRNNYSILFHTKKFASDPFASFQQNLNYISHSWRNHFIFRWFNIFELFFFFSICFWNSPVTIKNSIGCVWHLQTFTKSHLHSTTIIHSNKTKTVCVCAKFVKFLWLAIFDL